MSIKAGWALSVLLAAALVGMAALKDDRPNPRGNTDVREVGSQVVVGPNGQERTIPEKIIVDGEAFRVVE